MTDDEYAFSLNTRKQSFVEKHLHASTEDTGMKILFSTCDLREEVHQTPEWTNTISTHYWQIL